MTNSELKKGEVKVTLDPVDNEHKPSAVAEMKVEQGEERKRTALVIARMSAMIRLQYLEDKRRRNSEAAVIVPEHADDKREYQRLMDWWKGIGNEKQNLLMLMAQDCAANVHLLEMTKGAAL